MFYGTGISKHSHKKTFVSSVLCKTVTIKPMICTAGKLYMLHWKETVTIKQILHLVSHNCFMGKILSQ